MCQHCIAINKEPIIQSKNNLELGCANIVGKSVSFPCFFIVQTLEGFKDVSGLQMNLVSFLNTYWKCYDKGHKEPSVNTIFVYPARLSVRVEFPVPLATRVEGGGGVSLIGNTGQNLERYFCAFQKLQ